MVQRSELNAEFRLDAEYFQKSYIERREALDRFGTIVMGNCVTDGIHTSIDYDEHSAVRLLSATSPRENYFDLSRDARMSEAAQDENPRTALKCGDVIISTVGTIGNCAVVEEDILPANCDRHVGIIRKKNYSPYVLSTFLLSKYGRCQTDRECTGNVQLNLFVYKIKELCLPRFSQGFQIELEKVVKNGYDRRLDAGAKYREAEEHLLKELGFANWKPEDGGASTKLFSEVAVAGRIDAEYFQPKFDKLIRLLSTCELRNLGGADGLTDMYKSIDPSSDNYGDEGVPFVRIANLSKFGIEPPEIRLPEKVCKDCCRICKDTILLTKDGSVGIAYKAETDFDMVTSGAILHLTLRDGAVDPDYLALVLNSRIVQMQAERDAGGSIIQHWKPSQIEKVKIPILPRRMQLSLAEKVRESFRLRNESKRLLDLAKSAVELAIEKGEGTAMKQLSKSKV